LYNNSLSDLVWVDIFIYRILSLWMTCKLILICKYVYAWICHFFSLSSVLSVSLAFLFKSVFFLTMSSRISSDHKWNYWRVHLNTVLLFFFSFVCWVSKFVKRKKEFERLTEWDETGGGAPSLNITYSTEFFSFILLFSIALSCCSSSNKKKRTVDQVIKFRYTHLLQKETALLHIAF